MICIYLEKKTHKTRPQTGPMMIDNRAELEGEPIWSSSRSFFLETFSIVLSKKLSPFFKCLVGIDSWSSTAVMGLCLCVCASFLLQTDAFQKPVPLEQHPDYAEYIFHPMDLCTLEKVGVHPRTTP